MSEVIFLFFKMAFWLFSIFLFEKCTCVGIFIDQSNRSVMGVSVGRGIRCLSFDDSAPLHESLASLAEDSPNAQKCPTICPPLKRKGGLFLEVKVFHLTPVNGCPGQLKNSVSG